jgi:hypothetical protein
VRGQRTEGRQLPDEGDHAAGVPLVEITVPQPVRLGLVQRIDGMAGLRVGKLDMRLELTAQVLADGMIEHAPDDRTPRILERGAHLAGWHICGEHRNRRHHSSSVASRSLPCSLHTWKP